MQVGDLTTRFKYVPVEPTAFDITPAEILMATDQELNQYVSIKKYAPYRKESKWSKSRVEKLPEFKQTLHERLAKAGWTPEDLGAGDRRRGARGENGGGEDVKKKRMGKKERMRLKELKEGQEEGGGERADDVEDETITSAPQNEVHNGAERKEEKKSKDKQKLMDQDAVKNSVSPLEKKRKHREKHNSANDAGQAEEEETEGKKRKRRKSKIGVPDS